MGISIGSGSRGGFKISARQGGAIGVVATLAFAGWAIAYATGMFLWTGRQSGTMRSFGVGKISVIGNTNRTNTFGFKSFYYLAGQEAVLHYAADIKAGGLRIYLTRAAGLAQRVSDTRTVSESGAGQISHRIPVSGLYRWSIRPTVARGSKGYDLTYTASWGARPAG